MPPSANKPGLDGIDAFSIQGFKKQQDTGGLNGGGAGNDMLQQQQPLQPGYNNVPLNQIPAKGE